MQSTEAGAVSINVYDMLGRLVDNKELKSNDLSTLQLGSNYPTGVYNVIVSQNNNSKSFKMIKQ